MALNDKQARLRAERDSMATEEETLEANQETAFQIIATVGSAKSQYIEAIQKAKDGDIAGAKALIANGVKAVAEGANMPSTPEAIEAFQKAGVLFGPAKAANAGGVATSGLEMSQNSERLSWTFEEVDKKLEGIMKSIYAAASSAAVKYGQKGNLVMGANIAGFLKVADAMKWQGAV